MFPLGAHDARSVPFVRCGSCSQALVDLGGLQALLTYTYCVLAVLSFGQDGHGVGATVAYRAEPAAEDVGLDQIHRDDLLRFHSHRSFNGRVPPRAVADVAVPQPAGGGGLWRMEK